MTLYVLLVRDIEQNKHFVFGSPVSESGVNTALTSCTEYLKTRLTDLNNKTVTTGRYHHYCDIIIEENTVVSGWLWSWNSTIKQVMYTVSCVPVVNANERKTAHKFSETQDTPFASYAQQPF